MEDSKWLLWLRATTGEESFRGIARATGVTHPTVARWVSKGIPAETVWELTVRLNGDPIAALILLDRIKPAQTGDLNYSAIVKYAPEHALTSELHRRAVKRHRDQSLGRSDALARQSFRLTAR